MTSVFFCGIGGIGMSALARLLHSEGVEVYGSDASDSLLLTELENEGMHIFRNQNAKNIPADCVEFIFTEAIPETNAEWQEAKKRKIPQKTYFQKLGEISKDFFTICIAGTHGKSTTTTMMGLALEKADIDPNVIVGTKVFEWGKKNFRKGSSNVLVVESCEYRESFLHLAPDVIVITSLEPEHLDYYKTAERYFEGFQKFIAKLPEDGSLIADFEDANVRIITASYSGHTVDSSQFIHNVPELSLKGGHNISNASKVLALFHLLDIDIKKAKASLQEFRGSWRRFEMKGEKNGVLVIDDYGHHPTEIQATLSALSDTFPDKKKWVVFQPHQYSRTAEFLKKFGQSFGSADEILIPNIYRVRDSEEDVKKVSPEMLVEEIQKNISSDQRVRYTESFEKTVAVLTSEIQKGDVILTIGAGPVYEVGEMFLQ